VLEAHERFYAAINEAIMEEARTMADVWHHGENVTTTHPLGSWAVGWEQVWATWKTLGEMMSDGGVEVTDLHVVVLGDVAYTVGVEHVSFVVLGKRHTFTANTTNIYRRGEDGWKIIHHHPDKAPEVEETVGR
jgi:ketosteroid isomerase-like protein